LLIIKT
jgi:hypothetical protein